MTNDEIQELVGYFMAALQATIPAVTSEQRALVREVLAGMIREHLSVAPSRPAGSASGRRDPTNSNV